MTDDNLSPLASRLPPPPDDQDAMVGALEETVRQMMDLLRELPWEHTPGDLERWEELLERTAQVRIRLQQARSQGAGDGRQATEGGRGQGHGD